MVKNETIRITLSIGLATILFAVSFFIINYYNPLFVQTSEFDIYLEFIIFVAGIIPAIVGTSFIAYLILISIEYTVENKTQKFKSRLKWAHFFYNEGVVLMLNVPLFLFFYFAPTVIARFLIKSNFVNLDIRIIFAIIVLSFVLVYFILKKLVERRRLNQ